MRLEVQKEKFWEPVSRRPLDDLFFLIIMAAVLCFCFAIVDETNFFYGAFAAFLMTSVAILLVESEKRQERLYVELPDRKVRR